jgi:NADH-quinone oxidoreductase subunit J
MNLNMEYVIFSVFAAVSWATALGVVVMRDPVKSALSLVGCFFCISCLYLLQAAELMAVLEVLVYAGAIMVLFVFVIMLVEQNDEPIIPIGTLERIAFPIKLAAVGVVTLNMMIVLYRHAFAGGVRDLPSGFGGPQAAGKLFFSNYVFHFELASVLLVVAMVGAVMISSDPKKQQQESTD